ncbi:hypothetical protein [Flavicella sp.]|uniref:hypothetical protein n=1 Tax=Flavicella sp. TaxID=2957742 RepID=UPI0026370C04|nr:hypothetical protein [Flavicella sp.]MDG1805504.1 hypothetical protein [Flavicella sp.]
MHKIYFIIVISFISLTTYSQTIDSTQIGKEYPYVLPILGKKAYAKGYELQKPFGVMLGSLFNKQGIVIDNFEMAISDDQTPPTNYFKLDGILDFGPSEGRINTVNARIDAWILPFFSVGGYYGEVWGEQDITFSVVGSDLIKSTTDIRGKYYGLNLLGVAPLGPVNIAADYSWSWTTNARLDKPVLVNVSGIRVIRRIMTPTKGRFWAIWGGAQFQKLDSQTSGNIAFDEALGITEEDKQNLDNHWNDFKNGDVPNGNGDYWSDLSPAEKIRATATYNLVRGVVDKNVYYKFNKRLEHEWNMLLGFNYQHNNKWQFRGEYGFLKSKQQLMLALNYRFGL